MYKIILFSGIFFCYYTLLAEDFVSGSMFISSIPDSAYVLLDDELRGETPLYITDIPLGVHTIIVHKVGYEDIINSVVIEPNKTDTLEVSLEPRVNKSTSLLSKLITYTIPVIVIGFSLIFILAK